MTRGERAQQVWQVLAGAAHNRQILTYSIVADCIGMGAGTLAPVLGCIMRHCKSHGLPPLTVLVVNKETGLPGSGLTTLENLARDREAVFAREWYKMLPPSPDELEAAADWSASVAVDERPARAEAITTSAEQSESSQPAV